MLEKVSPQHSVESKASLPQVDPLGKGSTTPIGESNEQSRYRVISIMRNVIPREQYTKRWQGTIGVQYKLRLPSLPATRNGAFGSLSAQTKTVPPSCNRGSLHCVHCVAGVGKAERRRNISSTSIPQYVRSVRQMQITLTEQAVPNSMSASHLPRLFSIKMISAISASPRSTIYRRRVIVATQFLPTAAFSEKLP